MEKLGSSRSPMEESEKSTLLFLHELNGWEGRREPLEGKGKGINTPRPNGQLSHGSAVAQLWQCRSATMPLFGCGTVAPGKTTRVRMECW